MWNFRTLHGQHDLEIPDFTISASFRMTVRQRAKSHTEFLLYVCHENGYFQASVEMLTISSQEIKVMESFSVVERFNSSFLHLPKKNSFWCNLTVNGSFFKINISCLSSVWISDMCFLSLLGEWGEKFCLYGIFFGMTSVRTQMCWHFPKWK